MKIILIVILGLFNINLIGLEFSVGAKKHEAMPIVLGVFGKHHDQFEKLILQLSKDLEFSKQFQVQLVKSSDDVLKKEFLQNLANKNIPFAIFINDISNQSNEGVQFEWRLYDLYDLKMMIGKKITYQGNINFVAHMIANLVWPKLMGCDGYFNSMIVACKKERDHDRRVQYIYGFHFTNGTSDKQKVVSTSTINFAPRWHPRKKILYYSQHTPHNVRLMAIDQHGRKQIVTNFEGLNLTPAISQNGQIIVSLSSGGCEKLYQYEYDAINKLNKFMAITDCRMHSISPSFIDEENVVFCAIDSKSKLPRITIMNIANRTATFLTGKEFCVSPDYCKKNNKIAYCKRIKGYQQLFCYDLNSKKHEQLTFSAGDKDECSWSPCGNYIVFTEDGGKHSRIAIWSMLSSSLIYLSPKGESWCFPSWSPCYDDHLFVKC